MKGGSTDLPIFQRADLSIQEHSDIPVQEHDHHSSKRAYRPGREVFLTFDGLMHALHGTRTPVATEFRKWVYTQVFAIAYGTPAQKKAMIRNLCQVDKSFLQAFMKLVPNDIACLYLVKTDISPESETHKTVYKYGYTKGVKDRHYKHNATFGDNTLLDTVVFVPRDDLSTAETELKKAVAQYKYGYQQSQEMVLLDEAAYKSVRSAMQMIADKFNGSMTLHAAVVRSEMKDQAHDYEMKLGAQELKFELRIKDLERMAEVLKGAVIEEKKNAEALLLQAELKLAEEKSKAATQLGNAAAQLAEEKSKAAAQLAEEKSKTATLQQQLDTQLETLELRMKVLKLEHAAELAERLAEKDRRIAELEETNRRLGKLFPDAA